MVIYNLAFSQRSVYPYSWWNVRFLSFSREHPHGKFGDQEWLQPQEIHTRWSRRYVIKKFAVEEIFQQFLRTLVPKYEWSMDIIKCDRYMCCSRMWNVYLCTKICIFIRIYVRKLPVCSLACCELAQCSLLASLIV